MNLQPTMTQNPKLKYQLTSKCLPSENKRPIIVVTTRDRVRRYHSLPAIYPSLTACVATVTALLAVKHVPLVHVYPLYVPFFIFSTVMDLPNCRLLVFSVIGLIVVRGGLNAALWIYEIYVSQFDIATVAVKREPPST